MGLKLTQTSTGRTWTAGNEKDGLTRGSGPTGEKTAERWSGGGMTLTKIGTDSGRQAEGTLPTVTTGKAKRAAPAAAKRNQVEGLPSVRSSTARLQEQARKAAVDLDTETLDRVNRQLKEIRAAEGEQTLGDRVSDTLSAIFSGSGSSYTNLLGFGGDLIQDPEHKRRQIARLEASLASGRTSDGRPITEAQRQTIREAIKRLDEEAAAAESPESIVNRLHAAADRMQDDSARFQEQAKEGLGVVGGTVVDAATSMGQSLLDNALGAATGTGMLPFVARSLGGAAQEARRGGGDLDQQLLYGSAQAAKEYVTEKLFGLAVPQKLLGSAGRGSMDDAIEKGIRNVTERLAKTEGGQKAIGGLLTWLAGGATEGLEEGIGSVIENTLINPNLREWDPDRRTRQEKFEDGLYDMLVGGVSGLMGVTNLFGYQPLSLPTLEGTNTQTTQEITQGVQTEEEGKVPAQTEKIAQRTQQTAGEAVQTAVTEGRPLPTLEETKAQTDEETAQDARTREEGKVPTQTAESAQRATQAVEETVQTAEPEGLSLPALEERVSGQKGTAPQEAGREYHGQIPGTTSGGLNKAQEIQQNGGLNDGEETGEPTGQREGISVGDRGRISGTRAGGEAGELAKGAGAAGGAIEQSRTAVKRQNLAKDLRRERISSRELGLGNGTDAKSISVVPLDDWDDPMFQTAERIWDETGIETVYVLGGIQVRGADGGVKRVRGVYEPGKRIVIQADHLRCTVDQIADHEVFHDKAFQTPGLVREIEDRIAERYGREEFNRVVDTYIEKLRGIVDVSEDATGEEIEAAYQAILEEIYADAYAGINAFSAHAERYQGDVEDVLEEKGIGRGQQNAEATDRITGPPEARFSLNEGFETAYDEWAEHYPDASVSLYVGNTSEALRSIGVPDSRITWDTGKIRKIKSAHPAMTDAVLKQVPKIIEDPVVIMRSKNSDSRLTMFGEVTDGNGTPVLAVLELHPLSRGGIELDELKIASAYGKDSPQGLLDSSELLYLSPDKKRTDRWLRDNRLQLPFSPAAYGSIASIPQQEGKIKGEDQGPEWVSLPTPEDGKAKERYSIDEDYAGEVDAWDKDGRRSGETFILGSTGEVLQGLGAMEQDIFLRSEKVNAILQKHPEMTLEEIKRLPEILDDPVLVLKSRNAGRDGKENTRLVLFGTVRAENGQPVMTVLDLRPVEGRLLIDDMQKVSSAYARSNALNYVRGSDVLYADEHRTLPLLRQFEAGKNHRDSSSGRLAHTGSAELLRSGSMGSITYRDGTVNLEGVPFSDVVGTARSGPERVSLPTLEDEKPKARFSVEDKDQAAERTEETPRTELEALQKEAERLGNIEYQTKLLREGGAEAVNANEKELKKLQRRIDKLSGKKAKKAERPARKPVAESKPMIAKQDLRKNLLSAFSIPEGQKAELGTVIDSFADRLLRDGALTQADRDALFDRLYSSGVVTEAADEYLQEGRRAVAGGRVYVDDIIRGGFGDDWNDFRKRAFAAGVYLTNNRGDPGVDVWNQELSGLLPGMFDADELDGRAVLERIVQAAEEGKDQKVSLAEYTKRLAGEEYVTEDEILDNMERQMDWALRTFAEKADLELKLRDRTGVKIVQEREKFAETSRRQREREALRRGKERDRRREMMERQRENRELRELQQRTLKQLQWLSKNQYRAPKDLKAQFEETLGDIDLFAVGAANEMNWSKKYGATWRDLAQMYQEAKKNDPNFLPSKDLERIVARLDGDKIEDLDVSALQDLYKAAVGLRTEFYNRNNVINDDKSRMFAEVYADSKREIERAGGGYTGKGLDKFLNLEHLTPMNVLERMGGWNPDGAFYSMAKQLEQGERDARAYTVEAKRQLEDFLTEHEDWVKRADGQGKDAVWYELEVPELLELGMGDKPVFGKTVKVYMTPAQKVHLYLESKSMDNLRHMTGGRTFVDKELYSQGKRQEALAQGVTVKLAPETVKKIVSDLTEEEMKLAQTLERYYNDFAAKKINAVSNPLYGYDKAISKNYAPIYTNRNYTKSEIGIFDATAEGVGNLKGRQYAVNPSYNISAFDAFERHIDQTSRFVGMAIPARNWQTLLNWREKDNSTGDVITHKWGEEGKRYIEDLLTELQGGKIEAKSSAEKLMDTTLSNYISSVFGFNPSIVFKQAMSFPLAGTYLGWENVPNISAALKTDDKLINTYTSELAYRLMGYATPETAQLKNNPSRLSENKFLNFTFNGGAITAMDGWTVKSMWRWAENAVRRENPELETGTAEQIEAGQSPFYKEVARRFEEAVSRSQPMYDVMHRAGIMRNGKGTVRALTLFKTVPLQQYNMLRQTIAEAEYAKKTRGKDSEAAKDASRKAGRAMQGVILAGLGIEAINFLNAMLKNGAKYYRDDEDDELTWASVGQEFLTGFAKDNLGMIAGGDLAAEILGSAITGDQWYGIETPGITQIQDVLEEFIAGCKNIQKLVQDGYSVAKNGGNLGTYFRRHGADYLGALEEALGTVATYFGGVAYNNVKSYTLGALQWMSPEIQTAYEDFLKTADKTGLKSLTGGALETRVSHILKNRLGKVGNGTAEALAALYEAGFKTSVPSDTPDSVSVDGESRKLDTFQKQLYDSVWRETVGGDLEELVDSDAFRKADQEARAKMLKGLYDYAGELAKAEVFDDYALSSTAERIREALKTGIGMADYLELKENGAADRYLKAAEAGADPEDAARAALAATQAKETAGKDAVKPELYREALRAAGSREEQMAALSLLMGEAEYARLEASTAHGITPEEYVTSREAIDEINDNQSVSQEEAARAIGSLPGLSDEERAVLWQLQNKGWKPERNPFSVKAGREVYQELQRTAAELAEAKARGITDGTKPGAFCTRAQAAVMTLRAAKN